MGTRDISFSIASQRAPSWPQRSPPWRYCNNRPQILSLYSQLAALPRLRCSPATTPTERCSFGALGLGLGLVSSRSVVVRAQKEDKEGQKVGKVEKKSSAGWTSPLQRAKTVSRIFVATLVWTCLFLWISVTNSETGGGGRRPRK